VRRRPRARCAQHSYRPSLCPVKIVQQCEKCRLANHAAGRREAFLNRLHLLTEINAPATGLEKLCPQGRPPSDCRGSVRRGFSPTAFDARVSALMEDAQWRVRCRGFHSANRDNARIGRVKLSLAGFRARASAGLDARGRLAQPCAIEVPRGQVAGHTGTALRGPDPVNRYSVRRIFPGTAGRMAYTVPSRDATVAKWT
jgi:hypothetical protein